MQVKEPIDTGFAEVIRTTELNLPKVLSTSLSKGEVKTIALALELKLMLYFLMT
ncbi:MAG: hypothetical protein ACP5HX_09390 [Thermoproteota archaeon]